MAPGKVSVVLLRVCAEVVRREQRGGAASSGVPPWTLGLGAAGLLELAALAWGLPLRALVLAPAEMQVLRKNELEVER